MLVGTAVASYPLRRVLYRETWTLGGYLAFYGRLIAGLLGFWLLLALVPAFSSKAGPYDWLLGSALALVLLLWNWRYVEVARATLGARPILQLELVARFERLVAAASVATPHFEQVHAGGGVVANAIALPSLRRSAVLFSDTLLDRLTADEIEAICAHELAHLEHFNPRRLRRGAAAVSALVLLSAAAAPLVRQHLPAALALLPYLWFGAVPLALMLAARSRRRQETASDLRAVALTGNPDALVSALVKLHAIARVPRRWDAEFERRATHPSLARRVQAIRAAAGIMPGTVAEPTSFGASADQSIAFEAEHVTWSERQGATHRLPYSQLAELRVHATPNGPATLIIIDGTARRWEIPLAADEVTRAQAVLDVIDTRLAAPALQTQPKVPRGPVRAIAALAAFLVLLLAQWGAALAIGLAAVKPASPLLNGAGAALLVVAWQLWSHPPEAIAPTPATFVVAICGVVLLVAAFGERRRAP